MKSEYLTRLQDRLKLLAQYKIEKGEKLYDTDVATDVAARAKRLGYPVEQAHQDRRQGT